MSIEDEGFSLQSRFHCSTWQLLLSDAVVLNFSLISILRCLIINMSNKLQIQALQARKRAKSKLSGFPKANEESEISVVRHF